jgi:putative ABC transport system permease protein
VSDRLPLLWRVAWRSARASPARHLLIVVLLTLAVAGSIVVSVVARVSEVSPAEHDQARFGAADLRLERTPAGVPYEDLPPTSRQEVDERYGGPLDPLPVAEVDAWLAARLPAEATVTTTTSGSTRMSTSEGGPATWVEVLAADPADPVLEGLLVGDVDRAPGAGEALASEGLLRAAGAEVGDRIDLAGLGSPTIVGRASDPVSRGRGLVVLGPDTSLPRPTTTWWVTGIGADEARAVTRAAERSWHDAPTAGEPREANVWASVRGDEVVVRTGSATVLGSVVAAVLLVQVAFVAAAAFATGTRRRVREFGLLAAAAGAEPRQVRALVRREALVLGAVGATGGAVLGVAATLLGRPLIAAIADRPVEGIGLTVPAVLVPALLALAASLVAAWLPARTVASVPAVTALAGRVPLRRVARWVTPVSLVVVAVGASVLAISQRSPQGGWAAAALHEVRRTALGPVDADTLRTAGLLVGVALLLAGFAGLAGPLVQLLGRGAGRLPVTGRLAVRDSARQRTRSAATVAATMVVLSIPVAVVTLSASERAAWAEGDGDDLGPVAVVAGPAYGDVLLSPTDDQFAAALAVLPPVAADLALPMTGTVDGSWFELSTPDEPELLRAWGPAFHEVGVLTDTLRQGLGVPAGPQVAVLVGRGPDLPADRFDAELRLVGAGDGAGDGPAVVEVVALEGQLPRSSPTLLLPPELVAELDLPEPTTHRLLQLAHAPDQATWDAAWAVGEDASPPFSVAVSSTGGRDGFLETLLWTAAIGALLALAIAAATTALAATESDHDLRTMAAVGADPGLRPRFRAVQAGLQVAAGGLLAAPAGLLLATVMQRADAYPTTLEVPWLAVLGLLVLTPLVVAVPFRLASRRGPRHLDERRPA